MLLGYNKVYMHVAVTVYNYLKASCYRKFATSSNRQKKSNSDGVFLITANSTKTDSDIKHYCRFIYPQLPEQQCRLSF